MRGGAHVDPAVKYFAPSIPLAAPTTKQQYENDLARIPRQNFVVSQHGLCLRRFDGLPRRPPPRGFVQIQGIIDPILLNHVAWSRGNRALA
jgi:hypothetical protein